MNESTGTLYVVATPIGNLEDITLRALTVLGSVDLVLSEDTRVTAKLFAAHSIQKKLIRYDSHSKSDFSDKMAVLLTEGKNIALVSDAGTPGISDPGMLLVHTIRGKYPTIPIVAIPGPSAVTAALSASGLPASDFLFLGFLPHKKGRQTLLQEIKDSKRTVVLYESPHRILKLLDELEKIIEGTRTVIIGRELTKHFEEFISGTASELKIFFAKNPEKVRGEFVVMIEALGKLPHSTSPKKSKYPPKY